MPALPKQAVFRFPSKEHRPQSGQRLDLAHVKSCITLPYVHLDLSLLPEASRRSAARVFWPHYHRGYQQICAFESASALFPDCVVPEPHPFSSKIAEVFAILPECYKKWIKKVYSGQAPVAMYRVEAEMARRWTGLHYKKIEGLHLSPILQLYPLIYIRFT